MPCKIVSMAYHRVADPFLEVHRTSMQLSTPFRVHSVNDSRESYPTIALVTAFMGYTGHPTSRVVPIYCRPSALKPEANVGGSIQLYLEQPVYIHKALCKDPYEVHRAHLRMFIRRIYPNGTWISG